MTPKSSARFQRTTPIAESGKADRPSPGAGVVGDSTSLTAFTWSPPCPVSALSSGRPTDPSRSCKTRRVRASRRKQRSASSRLSIVISAPAEFGSRPSAERCRFRMVSSTATATRAECGSAAAGRSLCRTTSFERLSFADKLPPLVNISESGEVPCNFIVRFDQPLPLQPEFPKVGELTITSATRSMFYYQTLLDRQTVVTILPKLRKNGKTFTRPPSSTYAVKQTGGLTA